MLVHRFAAEFAAVDSVMQPRSNPGLPLVTGIPTARPSFLTLVSNSDRMIQNHR
jgi:hypothetical protein